MTWNRVITAPQRGPVLDSQRRRRSGFVSMSTLGFLVLCGTGLWVLRVIGTDLDKGRHVYAKHDDGKASDTETAAAKSLRGPGGPAAAVLPGRKPVLQEGNGRLDPVAQALLSGARDQLARKVAPVTVAVDDPHAAKASAFDLVDRGLSDLLPLRTALLRHRQREPQRYGLNSRPVNGADDRRRALTGENLAVFLTAFATQLGDQAPLEAGDVVLVERKRTVGWRPAGKIMPAVVSDAVDENGAPLIITLDPFDRAAREQGLGSYVVKQRFRLRNVDLERMRTTLDLGDLRATGPIRAM